ASDPSGNLIFADSENNRIRRINMTTGIITTIAGNGNDGFGGDGGPAVNAGFSLPTTIAVDTVGNIFVADTGNDRVRRIDAQTGIITTVAGNGCEPFIEGCPVGDGKPATNAGLSLPFGIVLDTAGNLIIADTFDSRVRRVDARTGFITTIAGNGIPGFGGDGGPARSAILSLPVSGSVDGANNIFIVESGDLFGTFIGNNRVRRIDAQTGIITTVAGNGQLGFSGDGGPAKGASLNAPFAATAGGGGNLLIADLENHRI